MKNRFLLIFLFFCLFALAAFERFYKLTEIGLDGTDTFFYWEMARNYLAGHFVMTEHYRPLAYGLYALAMKWGGVNFYSIKFLNCSLDLLNGALCAWIAYRMSFKPWVAWVSALLYFALVEPVLQARTELLHIPSTTPLLLSFAILQITTERQGWPIWKWSSVLVGSGIFLGLGANIHPTVALMGPGFALAIFIWAMSRETKQNLYRALSGVAAFTAGFAIPFIGVALLMGGKDVSGSLASNRGAQTEGLNKLGGNIIWAIKSFVPENSSTLVALVFLAALIYVFAFQILRRRPYAWTAALILIFSYAALYVGLVPRYRLTRTFLPLMPLVLGFSVTALWDLFKNQERWKLAATAVVLVLASAFSIRHKVPAPFLVSLNQRPSIYLEAQKALGEGAKAKVLVAPLIMDHIRVPFTQSAYMDGHAQYLIHSPVIESKAMLAQEKIDFIIFFKEKWDYRVMSEAELDTRSYRKRLKPYFNWTPEEYSPQKEFSFWQESLKSWGYALMTETDRFAIWRKP